MMAVLSTVTSPLASYRSYPIYWDMQSVMTHLGVIAVAGLLLWLAINRGGWLLNNRRRYKQTHQGLFADLCRAHDLTRAGRTVLTQISETLPLNQCCRVFIDAQIVQQYAQSNPADADVCSELAQKLYGAPSRCFKECRGGMSDVAT